jgi:sucrose-phosphate phosphatase subfamily
MTPPLAVDIDGTLTGEDRAVDHRVLPILEEWDAPVVIATGKALPYPVALCEFAGIPKNVVAENGGVAFCDDALNYLGDREAADAVVREFEERGGEVGFGGVDLANRWRETEVAVSLSADEDLLREVAAEYGLEVVDTGFAYHVKEPGMSKGAALSWVAERLGHDPSEFVAVGDSPNDVSMFAVAGRSFAVANAHASAREAADEVVDSSHADGFLAAVNRYCRE